MSEIVIGILILPLAAIFYASGLMLWPIRRWLVRKRIVRGKALRLVFLAQLISFLAVAIIAAIRPRLVEHFYYWFGILMELNIVFTIAGVIAWRRDSGYEQQMAVKEMADKNPQEPAKPPHGDNQESK